FDEWLRRPGYPTVTADWAYDSTAHEITVTASQDDRFGRFQFPLTVAVVDSVGAMHRATVQMTPAAGAALARFPSPTAPAAVVLDPDVELLAALHVNRR